MRRRYRPVGTFAFGVAWALLVTACVLAVAPRATATIGVPGVDWWAAGELPPIMSSAPGGPVLARDDVAEVTCIGQSVCVAATTRPRLHADIEPAADGTYRFVVFDITGAGGVSSAAAEAVVGEPYWAPAAGVLQHGREYVWTVVGHDNEQQEYQRFVVDLQRYDDQPLDRVGPVSVGLGSGAVFTQIGVPIGDQEGLALGYTWPGASMPSMLPDGWTIAGEALEAVSYTHVEVFSEGDVVLLHAVDGTVVRYELDDEGRYAPPSASGQDLRFLYPELVATGDGWVAVEPWGTVSAFEADGSATGVESRALDGSVRGAVDVVAVGGRLVSVADGVTGRELRFDYLGAREHHPPDGFDRGSAEPRIAKITGFDGTETNLHYVDGRLARIETVGASMDLAYDGSGRLVEIREPLAADAVATEVRIDDESVRTRIEYDEIGRVVQVTSPEPTPGAAPQVRSYDYADGATTAYSHHAHGPNEAVVVTFDPDDLRPLTQTLPGQAPTTYLYDDGALLGWIDPTGMQTTLHRDPATGDGTVYGPAPAPWFDADGLPLAAHAAAIATRTSSNGAGTGMHAWFYASPERGSHAVAVRLLEHGDIAVPDVVDQSAGWRMTATGELPITGDTWIRASAPGADPTLSSLVIDGRSCDFAEACFVDRAGAAEPSRTLVFVDLHVPPGRPSASLEFEWSDDGVEWNPVGLDRMTGNDLPSTDSYSDVYRLGGEAVTVVEQTRYGDVSIGAVDAYLVDGEPIMQLRHEAVDPHDDRWARPTAIVRPSGLTTTLDYWGSSEAATHPLTGEQHAQAGGRKTLQVGDLPVYSAVYDDAGRVVATYADGALVEAVTFDDRGRVEEIRVPASGSTPERHDRHVYGADGDPLRTDVAVRIGDDEYVVSTTVDLLGRTVTHTDVWAVTTDVEYDQLGSVTDVVTRTADGVTTSRTSSWDARGIVDEHVVAADGTTYTATVVDRDQAGRATHVVYSNGVTLHRSFEPHTGVPTSTYTDAEGGSWTETVTATTQTGRILAHRLDTPTTAARYAYGYDPASGMLTDAALTVSGALTLDAEWTYDTTYHDDTCAAHAPGATVDGARAVTLATIDGVTTTTTTCYDATGAPTHQRRATAGGDAHDIAIGVTGGAVVAYGDLDLDYDGSGHLVWAADTSGSVDLTRTADGSIIEQRTTVDGVETIVRNATGGLRLDQHGHPVAQTFELGGAVVDVPLHGGATWSHSTYGGDQWWIADDDGVPVTTVPNLYTPDGQSIDLDDVDGGTSGRAPGWKHDHNGYRLDLETSVVVFGARTYLPDLASFTTADPQAHGGTTLYNYANGDPINLVDPTGHAAQGFKDFADWLDNVPPWMEIVIVGLIIILAAVPPMGAVGAGLAAVLTMVLAGYYTYKSITAFADGDVWAGAWYAFEVVLTVVIFRRLVKVAIAGKTNLVHTKPVRNVEEAVVPSQAPHHGLGPSMRFSGSLFSSGQMATHSYYVTVAEWVNVKMWLLTSLGLAGAAGSGILIDQLWSKKNTRRAWNPW